MVQHKITPSTVSYAAAINACSKGGQWQPAVDLLRELLQKGLKPDVTTYTATIDACSATGQWQQAVQLLREMQQQQQLTPDVMAFNCAISACQKGGNWQLAIELLREVQTAGLKPDQIMYRCLIDALHGADELDKAETMYLEMREQRLVADHWSARDK
eukprot:2313-Heterococcus_DN1.PRE.1